MLAQGCLDFLPNPPAASPGHTLYSGLGPVGLPRATRTLTAAPSVCSRKLSSPRNLPHQLAYKNWVISRSQSPSPCMSDSQGSRTNGHRVTVGGPPGRWRRSLPASSAPLHQSAENLCLDVCSVWSLVKLYPRNPQHVRLYAGREGNKAETSCLGGGGWGGKWEGVAVLD